MTKRLGYMAGLVKDLAIAKEEGLHPVIIAELEERIEAHKQYKRDYHKRTYKPRAQRVDLALALEAGNDQAV